MPTKPTTRAALRGELAAILRRVRRRRRLRRALLGAVWFLAAGACVALLAAFTVDAWRFAPEVVNGARLVSWFVLAMALVFLVGVPLFQRVSNRRLALYVEEREPSLRMALASATDLEDGGTHGNSPALERGLLEKTLRACRRIDDGRRVEAPRLRRNGLLLAAMVAALILVADTIPWNLRHAFQVVFFPASGVASVNPYRLTAEPGDVLVSRGADQLIVARAEGFEPDAVTLLTRFGETDAWHPAPMVPGGDTSSFEMFLFDLARSGEYRVASEGLRSPVYRIEVAELPKVERIDLTYHYPARLGLAPKTVIDAGDIRAVRGSRVEITIVPTQDVDAASVVLNGRESRSMTKREDGRWTSEMHIDEEGQYRIDLPYGDDTRVAASPNYAIEVLPDRAPAVKLSRFGRDSQVTSVEEALIEVTGSDDLNIATLELVYAVNDQPEQTVVLYESDGARTDVSADHMLALEDYGLAPGDLIAYYARASDATSDDALTSTTDIFFMQVRPFDRNFRRGQGGGNQGGQQGGQEDRNLSAQQRQLVIATFKLARDRGAYEEARFAETAETLETAQARIRDRVEAIIRRIGTRNVMQQNPGIRRMREELPEAVAAMMEAEVKLGEESPAEALPPARKALQHLQRAEAAFRDAQIAFGRSSGGGARDAEDLANLFRLEMDKLRNKYESVQRGNWNQGSEQLDEALKKLEELARRQQQELERLKRRAQLDPNAPSGGGSQRALAEELEEMVRRLERLSREQQTPELRNLIRQAKAAAEAMRRATGQDASGNGNRNGVADARAALDRLNNIQRLAENPRGQQIQRGIDNASRRARRLAQSHGDIGDDMKTLPEQEQARKESTSKLQSRKLSMAEDVRELESDLRKLAREAGREQADTAKRLRGTADAIEEDELADKIERSAAAIGGPAKEFSDRMEAEIGDSIARIGKGLGEAAGSVDRSEEQERAQQLAQMRDLVEGLESLERQMLERSRAGRSSTGTPRGGWGTADGQTRMGRDFDPAEIENLRRDFAERRGVLERLAGVLTADEHGARDISRLLSEMRAFEQGEGFDDPRRAMQRQRQLIAELKELELRLKDSGEATESRALPSAGGDTMPREYRSQVEEYFRELSRADASRQRAD
jgi:hypothetical protein